MPPSLCATQTIKASDAFKISPFGSVFFLLGYYKREGFTHYKREVDLLAPRLLRLIALALGALGGESAH